MLATAVIGVIVFFIALTPPSLIWIINMFAFGGLETAFFWTLLLGLFWRRANRLGALLSMGGGTIAYCLTQGLGFKVLGLHQITIGITVSLLFFLLFGFAIKNDQLVTLNFFFGSQWQLPLAFVILLTFAAGALLGVTATLASLVRQRREISRLRRQLELAERNKVASETALTAGEAQLPMP